MAQKRSNLQQSLNSAVRTDNPPQAIPKSKEKRERVLIGAMFDPAVRRQLKLLEAENDNNLNELLTEALNDLFEKHHKSRIA